MKGLSMEDKKEIEEVWVDYNEGGWNIKTVFDFTIKEGMGTFCLENLPSSTLEKIEQAQIQLAQKGLTFQTIYSNSFDIIVQGERNCELDLAQKKYWDRRLQLENWESINPQTALLVLENGMRRLEAFISLAFPDFDTSKRFYAFDYLRGAYDPPEKLREFVQLMGNDNKQTALYMALGLTSLYDQARKDLFNTISVNDAISEMQKKNGSAAGLSLDIVKKIDRIFEQNPTKTQIQNLIIEEYEACNLTPPSTSTMLRWIKSRQKVRGFKSHPRGRPKS
ncbi:MAG: hypothetical protein LPJ98_11050 [Cyclobacteriaceae bacterium]|nr:hypothetical protein [Cyclobacteriaceae bacterium]